jgi:REP element-mobilizing transposase RayT
MALKPRSGDIKSGVKAMAGTYTKLYCHLVFSTKNRQQFITPSIEDELHKYISGIVRGLGGSSLEINGAANHIHILAILPPKIAVSDALLNPTSTLFSAIPAITRTIIVNDASVG